MLSPRTATLLLAVAAVIAVSLGEQTLPAKSATVDLSLPASQRWDQALQVMGGKAAGVAINTYFSSLDKLVPKEVLDLLQMVAKDLDYYGKNIPLDMRLEMRALAAGLGLDVGLVLTLNYLYALRSLGPVANTTGPIPPSLDQNALKGQSAPGACTSIIGSLSDEEAVPVHVRNMDWNLPSDVRMLTFKCNFVYGKKPLFSGACFTGFVGIASGFRVGNNGDGFGITINERKLGGELLADIATSLFEGAWDPTHALREIMTSATDFDEALEQAKTIRLASPVYYIISGAQKDQGHVLTRDRLSVHSDRALDVDNGAYWVGQTNYDWDKSAPSYDDRRKYMIQFMTALKATGVTKSAMQDVISRWPLLNQHSAYTTVMIPSTGDFELFIRLNSTAEIVA